MRQASWLPALILVLASLLGGWAFLSPFFAPAIPSRHIHKSECGSPVGFKAKHVCTR